MLDATPLNGLKDWTGGREEKRKERRGRAEVRGQGKKEKGKKDEAQKKRKPMLRAGEIDAMRPVRNGTSQLHVPGGTEKRGGLTICSFLLARNQSCSFFFSLMTTQPRTID